MLGFGEEGYEESQGGLEAKVEDVPLASPMRISIEVRKFGNVVQVVERQRSTGAGQLSRQQNEMTCKRKL
jgi:hypothetical protein